jgi:acyl dehydratase
MNPDDLAPTGGPIPLDGPYYDLLQPGMELPRQPGVTLDSGICAIYQALVGERLALVQNRRLCAEVTGSDQPLVSPGLVMALSVGHTTTVSRRVIANLFYRDVRLRPVFQGQTLETSVRVVAMRDGRPRPDRAPRGVVLVACESTADGKPVATYQRCPMLPATGAHLPGFDGDIGSGAGDDDPTGGIDLEGCADLVPSHWRLHLLGERDTWEVGRTVTDPLRDYIDNTPALLHLTHNLAFAHRDAEVSPYGRRLVNGLQVAGMAQASLSRVLAGMATALAWGYCSHTGPVFEGDLLSFTHTLLGETPAGGGRVRAVRVRATAHRDDGPTDVLDWTLAAVTP